MNRSKTPRQTPVAMAITVAMISGISRNFFMDNGVSTNFISDGIGENIGGGDPAIKTDLSDGTGAREQQQAQSDAVPQADAGTLSAKPEVDAALGTDAAASLAGSTVIGDPPAQQQ